MKRAFAVVLVNTVIIVIICLMFWVTPLALIKGTLTDTMYDLKCQEGSAYIKSNSKEYYAGAGNLEQWGSKFNADLELGDSVVILCKVSPNETAPTEISILYLWEIYL